jgi:branched-chain amino acid transport system substrate-binding protein
MRASILVLCVTGLLLAAPLARAGEVKIGLITTLSGPAGAIGRHMKDGAELAAEGLGRKMGDLDLKMIYGDDQLKPDVGRQLAEEMIKRDNVDFMTGVIFSNVMLAMYQPILKSGKIFVSASAGPHEIAGRMCAPTFFSTAWQNDQSPEAMGQYLTDRKVANVYLIAPNYAAGKDMLAGFKRFYKGKIAAEVYTKLDQSDFQAELTQIRAANPAAVFAFQPGGLGIQFIKQYSQAGLKIPLFSAFTANEVILPALGDAATGTYDSGFWSADLDNPVSRAFVAKFTAKYGYLPSEYAASAFDAINLINSAVVARNGNLSDPLALRRAMEKADFQSVRGTFRFNTNHFPIQDYYVFEIQKGADGKMARKVDRRVLPEHKDAYYSECRMH